MWVCRARWSARRAWEGEAISRRSQRIKIWVFGALGVSALLLIVLALPHRAVSVGHTRAVWGITRGWAVSSWSGRSTEWDETIPPLPPCQFYQMHRGQFGPFYIVTSRRVAPNPGEVCE